MDTLNMKIGDGFHKILDEIAKSHLQAFEFQKAIKVYQESLIGIDNELIYDLLAEKRTLYTNKIDQTIDISGKISEENHLVKFTTDQILIITQDLITMRYQLERSHKTFSFKFELDIDVILRYFNNVDHSEILDIINNNDNVHRLNLFMQTYHRLVKKSAKLIKFYKEIEKTYSLHIDYYVIDAFIEKLDRLSVQFIKLSNNLSENNFDNDLQTFINKEVELYNSQSLGNPSDISLCYDAGFISPKGVFYGTNGKIENLLHTKLSNALQEKGIIPKKEHNPDGWLMKNGWVRTHGNWILYEGYFNMRLEELPILMTKAQIEQLKKMCKNCHEGGLLMGLRRELVTLSQLDMLSPTSMIYFFTL